jgi:hypothetical protein
MLTSDRKIRVMISSRCKDMIELRKKQVEFSVLRKKIKTLIEDIQPFGSPFFECWINESSPPIEGTKTSWEACLQQVRRANILIVLFNGNPGWTAEPDGVGICHAELREGLSCGAAKVFCIELPLSATPQSKDDESRYARFREYFSEQNLFVAKAQNGNDVLKFIPTILHEALAELVTLGGYEARKGNFTFGDALDWSHLDFEARKKAMEDVVRYALEGRGKINGDLAYIPIGKEKLLFIIHAIPAAITNAAARELVGRPFHHDYLFAQKIGEDNGGPVNLFACHRGVTENQAAALLGQPDVVTVDTSFGVLAVDHASKVQCIFLRNCRDDVSTRLAIQKMFDWLRRSGEDQLLVKRGFSRARIVRIIAKENP